jgi:hypothetical protein
MRHNSLPTTLTVEQLGAWIGQNKIGMDSIVEKVDFTEDEIAEFEHKSSKASREIDRLEYVQKKFTNFLKKGTEAIVDEDKGVVGYEDQEITIPGTVGLDTLKENRRFADSQIEAGHRTLVTELYFIPWPEKRLVVAVDIEGNEYPDHSREMTEPEAQNIKPLLMEVVTSKKGKKDKKQKINNQVEMVVDQDDDPLADL